MPFVGCLTPDLPQEGYTGRGASQTKIGAAMTSFFLIIDSVSDWLQPR